MNNEVRQAIRTIINELNGGNSTDIANTILDTVLSDHRTLQQLFWGAMLKAQIGYAEARHDLRNEDAVALAKLVKETVEKNNIGGLRYI